MSEKNPASFGVKVCYNIHGMRKNMRNGRCVEAMKSFGKFVRGKAFSILFFVFSFLSVFYVAERMGRLTESLFSYHCDEILCVCLLILMGYMFLYLKSGKEKKRTRNLYECCSVILCFLLYLVLILWIYDILSGLLGIHRNQFYSIPVLGSLFLTIYGFVHAKKLYVQEYTIPLRNLNTEKKIALLSDIHVGTFVDIQQLNKIVAKVNELHPDYVLIAGDMFDVDAFAYCEKDAIAAELQKLAPQGNIYAVLGNHDPKSSRKEIREFFENAKVQLLVDEEKETEDFTLVGRDDSMRNPKRKSLLELLKTVEGEKPKIVIDHNPTGIKEAVSQNVDLILCGHTHKGQFFPANIFTKLAYGTEGFYGYGREGNTQSVVSSGTGYFQMPMRIGSNSEVVVLNLKREGGEMDEKM